MAGSLTERLQLIVDATTGQAEAKFAKLGDASAATAKTTTASANQVSAAADRIAQARLREEQAAGLVRVAEARLAEVRATSGARASQIAAAEERLAAAERNLAAATRQTTVATQERAAVNAAAVGQAEQLGRSTGAARQALVGLATAGAAFAGIGLVDYLRDSITGFVEGARTASQLSISMNATVEQAGQLGALAKSIGLDFNDLLEIQAEFAQKVAANGSLLDGFGAAVKRNEDGTTNWALTLEDALVQLEKIPDATKRNQLGFQLFGEEGFKQLSRLLVSGVSVKDALDAIGTPFSKEDVAAVQAYNQQLMELSLTGTRIENTLGRALLPVVAGVAEGFADFLDIVTQIPLPIAAATVAAVALGVTGFSPAAIAGARLEVVMAAVTRQLAYFNVLSAVSGRSAAVMAAGMGAAGAAGRGLLAAVGGPLGVALIGAGVAYTLVSQGIDRFKEASREAAVEQEANRQKYGDMAATTRELGQELSKEAGVWDGLAASRRGASQSIDEGGGIGAFIDDISGGALTQLISFADQMSGGEEAAKGYTDEIERQKEELGAYGVQAETAQIAVKGLNDLIAAGTTSGPEYAAKVREAADAQAEQSRTADLAKASIAALLATTQGAVQATLDLFNAQLGQSDGLIGVKKAMYELSQTVDDAATPWDEVEEATNRALEAALSYGENAADAAVAAATAAGTALTPLTEAQIRADATIAALKESLNAPGLTDGARGQLESMIGQLETAKTKGDIQAILTLTGVPEATGELDAATGDRETTINVESAGGPAVDTYLDGLASQDRLALVRVESRGGPDVVAYLLRVTDQARLAIIHVESRGGPAVDTYLDGLADQDRLAIIRVESRGGPDVDRYLDGLANQSRTAVIHVQRNAPAGSAGGPTGLMRGAPAGGLMAAAPGGSGGINATVELVVKGEIDRSQLSKARAGKVQVENIRAYERRNGTGWRSDT